MTEEQSLTILINAASQAKLSRADHALVEQAHAALAERLGLIKPEEAESDNG